jgi:hypothetical protein
VFVSEQIKVLRVSARRNGYRRAGLHFGETAASIPLSALTSHQVKELRTDRMLATETADAVVLLVGEHAELERRSAIADELVALLPADFTWTRSPVEYVANLVEQLRVQTARANALQAGSDTLQSQLTSAQAGNDTLRAQIDELEAKVAAKASHTTPRR